MRSYTCSCTRKRSGETGKEQNRAHSTFHSFDYAKTPDTNTGVPGLSQPGLREADSKICVCAEFGLSCCQLLTVILVSGGIGTCLCHVSIFLSLLSLVEVLVVEKQ